jgi:uroporphyrinogen III methyltransferase/synthase
LFHRVPPSSIEIIIQRNTDKKGDELLEKKKIVVTRPLGQEKSFIKLLQNAGAIVFHCPTIKISPCYNPKEFLSILSEKRYDWVCFTSANGVNLALDFAEKEEKMDFFRAAQIACIGPATQETLKARGVESSLIPEQFQAEGLISTLQKENLKGKSFLLLRAKGARKILREALAAEGASVLEFPLYDTFPDPQGLQTLKALLKTNSADVITFTSSSTVRSFKQLILEERVEVLPETLIFASIGPITSNTLLEEGLWVNVEAKTSTTKGLVESLEEFFNP